VNDNKIIIFFLGNKKIQDRIKQKSCKGKTKNQIRINQKEKDNIH
jgi:hypothetical protein